MTRHMHGKPRTCILARTKRGIFAGGKYGNIERGRAGKEMKLAENVKEKNGER